MDEDLAKLFKAGFSLCGSILIAAQNQKDGKFTAAGGWASRSGSDLVDIVTSTYRLVSRSMGASPNNTNLTPSRGNVLNLTGNWDSDVNATCYYIEVVHNSNTGEICIKWPNGVGGVNYYYGAVNAGNIFAAGQNSRRNAVAIQGNVSNARMTLCTLTEGIPDIQSLSLERA